MPKAATPKKDKVKSAGAKSPKTPSSSAKTKTPSSASKKTPKSTERGSPSKVTPVIKKKSATTPKKKKVPLKKDEATSKEKKTHVTKEFLAKRKQEKELNDFIHMNSDESSESESEGEKLDLKLDDKTQTKVMEKIQALPKGQRGEPAHKHGVLYLGRIPHGFYEDQMRGFFSQFGTVSNLRLSRSKKTGRSKHYAFIEFENEEVMKIVQDCMDNYLLAGQLLTCKIIPPEKVHERIFVGANRKFRKVPWERVARARHNKDRTAEESEKQLKRLLAKEKRKREKLKNLGIDYEFEGYAGKVPAKPTHVRF